MTAEIAVVALVRREGRRYLLIERARGRPAAGFWTPVTGHIEKGEGERDAVARETFEEVGLRVVVREPVFECPAEGAPFLLRWFLAEPATGADPDALAPNPSEVAHARWVTAAEAARLRPMFEATRRFFEELSRHPRTL